MTVGKSISRRQVSKIGFAIFTAMGAIPALATTQNSTWVGTGGDSNWTTVGNWSPSGVPDNNTNGFTDYNVVIGTPSPTNLNASETIDSLTLNSGGLLDINNNTALTLNGATSTDNGTITVNNGSGGNQTQLIFTSGSISGAGSIVLDDNGDGNNARLDGILTQGAGHSIDGHGNINATLTNNGTVNANVASSTLNVNGAATNNSLMEATTGSLSINSVTVMQGTGGQIAAAGGTVNLSNATISGGTLNSSSGGVIQAIGTSTLASLTNNAAINVLNTNVLDVTGNLTDTGTITINNGSGGNQTQLSFSGGTVSGAGSIVLDDNGSPNNARLDGTLTQSSGHTISGHGNVNAALTNGGTVNGNVNGTVLNINGATTNNSLMEDTNGGELSINSVTVNQGTSGQVVANGGGTLGNVVLSNATITNGTLNSATAGIFFISGTSTIGSLTNNAPIDVQNNNVLNVSGNLTDNGTITVNNVAGGNQTQLIFAGGTLSGTGKIVLNDNGNGNNARLDGTLTQVSGHSITGHGNINAALTNSGIVNANVSGDAITLQTNNMTNTSTMEATGGGNLSINNITITNSGTIQATGNNGSGVDSSVNLTTAMISGGTLSADSADAINASNGTSTLEGGVTISTGTHFNVLNNQQANVNGTLTNNGTMTINSNLGGNQTILDFVGTGANLLTGSGSVVMTQPGAQSLLETGAGATLTVDTSQTIMGQGLITAVMTNKGTINANTAGGGSLTLQTDNVTNAATMEATGGGNLSIGNITVTNSGTIKAIGSGGSVFSSVNLSSATISGGTLTTDSTGGINAVNGVSTLEGSPTISVSSNYNIFNNEQTNVSGTLTNNGTITVNSTLGGNLTILDFVGTGANLLTGSGSVVMTQPGTQSVVETGTGATLTVDTLQTIKGQGVISAAMTNNGTINANTSGTTLNLQTNNMTNGGTMEATGGSDLSINGITVTNTGAIDASGTGSVVTLSGATISGGTLNGISGGIFTVVGTSAITSLTNNAPINITNNDLLNVNGNLTNSGTITINNGSGGNLTELVFAGGTVSGAGAIVMDDNGSPNTAYLGGTLTQASGHLIEGHGNLVASLTNNGTVNANVSATTMFVDGATVTNNSIMEATGGGTMDFQGGVSVTNTNGQIEAVGGPVNFSNMTLTGGTISSAVAEVITADNSTFAGNITLATGSRLNIDNNTVLTINSTTFTNDGTITINDQAGGNLTQLVFGGGTVSGTGAIVLNDNFNGNESRLDGTLTAGSGQIIEGHGNVNAALTNNGTVNANVSGNTLTLDNSSMTNNNIFEATSGATLQISGITVGQGASGIITTGNTVPASTVNITNAAIINNGSVASNGTGVFNVINGSLNNLTITALSQINVPTSDTLGFQSVVNKGTLAVAGTATGGPLTGTGTLSIAATGTVHLSTGTGLTQQNVLTIASGGKLDIGNNHVIIDYAGGTDPASTIYSYLQSGYAGGAWTGPGIDSVTAAANNAHYGVGFVDGKDHIPGATGVTSGQILIAYALYGDVNLDGLVNATDFAVFGANFNSSITGWEHGDFTYSGLVNGTDFALLGSNFGKSAVGTAVTLPANDWAALDAFAIANNLQLPTPSSVPEPASVGLLTLGAMGVLSRRRRCGRVAGKQC